MGRPKKSQPSYTVHKASGQARVRINGTDHYLGVAQSKESWAKYYQLLGDHCGTTQATAPPPPAAGERLPITSLIEAYLNFAKEHFGARSSEVYCTAAAVKPLDLLYGHTAVSDFGPLKLEKVLERMVLDGDSRGQQFERDGGPRIQKPHKPLSRKTANEYLHRMKKIFKWGVSKELCPAAVWHALETVSGIRKGRGGLSKQTRDPKKIGPVCDSDIEATLACCGPEIATLIRFQLLTGCRPDEATILRPKDIDRVGSAITGKCWVFRPGQHKNDWRGHEKEILIGPKAQELLQPWIDQCESEEEYLFSPRKVVAKYIAKRKAMGGKDPNVLALHKVRPPREHYDDNTYRKAVGRACRKAGVPTWAPNQLRHAAGTKIRSSHGIEGAQVVLGHRRLNTTEVYADKDKAKYAEIIASVG